MSDDIVQFLQARLQEDIDAQDTAQSWHVATCPSPAAHGCTCGTPRRVAVDMTVKKRLVGWALNQDPATLHTVATYLAFAYQNHPDYRRHDWLPQ